MFEEKKNIKTAEMTEEQMKKVSGGTGYEIGEVDQSELPNDFKIEILPVLPQEYLR